MISFDDFAKLELKVGTVLEAEDVAGSEKLIKLRVDLGPKILKPFDFAQGRRVQDDNSEGERDIRQILVGVKQWYAPEDFVGKQVIVVANLEPRKMMGLESQGMMLAADTSDGPVFLTVPKKVPAGTKIK